MGAPSVPANHGRPLLGGGGHAAAARLAAGEKARSARARASRAGSRNMAPPAPRARPGRSVAAAPHIPPPHHRMHTLQRGGAGRGGRGGGHRGGGSGARAGAVPAPWVLRGGAAPSTPGRPCTHSYAPTMGHGPARAPRCRPPAPATLYPEGRYSIPLPDTVSPVPSPPRSGVRPPWCSCTQGGAPLYEPLCPPPRATDVTKPCSSTSYHVISSRLAGTDGNFIQSAGQ